MSSWHQLKPFFLYFGAKHRATPHYPPPSHKVIVEPFAGAAGYSTRYFRHDIVLVEKHPLLAEMWRYLIRSSAETIRALPVFDNRRFGHVTGNTDLREFPDMEPGAKTLIGFWLTMGAATPSNRATPWGAWTPALRERIAQQVDAIRHWQIIEGDYTDASDIEATWYIDPPYQKAGKDYKHSSKQIDFAHLAEWCKTRKGQTIVCEAEGADWLPFEKFREIKATAGKNRRGTSSEAIWPSQPKKSGFFDL